MYGVVPIGNGSYYGRVPKAGLCRGYYQKHFAKGRLDDPKAEAAIWVEAKGLSEWGHRRWGMVKIGLLRRLRSGSHAVNVRKVTVQQENTTGWAEYTRFAVEWRDRDGNKLSKSFSKKKYGDLDLAEYEAHMFACVKRAELTGGRLNYTRFLDGHVYRRH